jgi:cell division protein FtsB
MIPTALSRPSRWAMLCFLALVWALPCLNAYAKEDPARTQWLTGYAKLEEAGKAEAARNFSLAVDLYRGARKVFREVRRKYPKWNPSLLDYRIGFCTSRIRRLEAALAANRSALSRTQLLETCNRLTDELNNTQEENRALQKKLDLTREALDRARREAARGAAAIQNVQTLIAARDRLKQELAAQKQQIAQLATQVADAGKLKKLQAQVDGLQQENGGLARRNTKLSEQLKTLRDLQRKLDARLKQIVPAYTRLWTKANNATPSSKTSKTGSMPPPTTSH